MSARPPPPVTAWSYSRLSYYRECPLKFKYKFLDKVPEEKGKALIYGDDVHKLLEKYVKRTGVGKLPAWLKDKMGADLVRIVEGFRARRVACEVQLAVDDRWRHLPDYFSPRTWFRAVFDVTEEVRKPFASRRRGALELGVYIADYKTGKVYADKHAEQLELYAPVAFARYPAARFVEAQMLYVDQGQAGAVAVYTRDDLPRLTAKWKKETQKLFADRKFKPTPSTVACRWCPFVSTRGGPCHVGAKYVQ